jgi:hypothetical protein
MRKNKLLLTLAAIVMATWSWHKPHYAQGGGTFVFPLSIKGTTNQTDVFLPPGSVDVIGKVNDKIIAAVLRGEPIPGHSDPDFATQYVHTDQGGKFYLFFDGRDTWRVATNPQGTGATTLTGQTSNKGAFWMTGGVDFPVAGPIATAFAVGKVKFVKGTFNPAKISGVVHFVSKDIGECFTLKFKTVGPPLV